MLLKYFYAIGITLDRDEARKATLLRDYIHDTVRLKAIVALPSLIWYFLVPQIQQIYFLRSMTYGFPFISCEKSPSSRS